MPIQEMISIQKYGSRSRKMALMLAMHCTPLIKSLMTACILILDEADVEEITSLLKGTNISLYFLCRKGEKQIVLLYRRETIMRHLNADETKKFLVEYGYNKFELHALMNRLAERINRYHNEGGEFPHEIGLFLGYPLLDVKGFIENKGENYEYMGYWKVYHNAEATIRLFKRFDREREFLVQAIVEGKSIQEIAV